MELFGYYFPPEIINWFCDDWINEVYRGINHFYPLQKHLCINIGGQPRYDINNTIHTSQEHFDTSRQEMNMLCKSIVERDLERIRASESSNPSGRITPRSLIQPTKLKPKFALSRMNFHGIPRISR